MSMKLTEQEYAALLRQDLSTFIQRCFYETDAASEYLHNWHIDLIASKLTDVLRGKIRRLIINIPPRYLKSLCASVAFPAWVLGHDPAKKIVCASYGQDLAAKLARDCRRVMQSPWYREAFPMTRLASARAAYDDFETTRGGGRLAVSTGGPMTGRGGDILIIDDPLKPDEAVSEVERTKVNQWFDGTAYSRLNSKAMGAIVIIMQRLHLDDLVGHLQAQEGGGWEVVSLPAIADVDEFHAYHTAFGRKRVVRHIGEPLHGARESLAVLEGIRATVGEFHFAGQYQQSPVPLGGGIIKQAWLYHLPAAQWPQKFQNILQSWDTASKGSDLSSYSVCTTWGILKGKMYLLDVFRDRLDFPALRKKAFELNDRFKPRLILVEDKSSGTQLIQEFKSAKLYHVRAVKPEGDKVLRLSMQAAYIESGALVLPEAAPWLADYVKELTSFPATKFADQVDSTTQALNWRQQTANLPGLVQYMRNDFEAWVAAGRMDPAELEEFDAAWMTGGKG